MFANGMVIFKMGAANIEMFLVKITLIRHDFYSEAIFVPLNK